MESPSIVAKTVAEIKKSDNGSGQVSRPSIELKSMPYHKYRRSSTVELEDRRWPSKILTQAPRWCSVDLRDGNQALLEPMNPKEKLRLFELLIELGFKEIETGFPAASQLDYDFSRHLIESNRIPEDTTIQVLCQARKELIKRTIESLRGVPKAIFHLYNSTSTVQRNVVFKMDRAGVIDLALSGVRWLQEFLPELKDTDITLEYSPESFTGTELDFAVEICAAVCDEFGASEQKPVIINLPATVEMTMPNVYADQIEWFMRNFPNPERIVTSLHTHNDRGTGVAATELALLAGAQRVEGTLFGNGERTGNVDIVTLAMNMFADGMNPKLDLHDLPRVVTIAQECTKLPIHPRHPYAGELVFTAFSGSHQDAIGKGLASCSEDYWEVPYLPIDPADVGASYKETVRVNSQSGKGGVAFILDRYFGISIERDHLVEFSEIIQKTSEHYGGEILPPKIMEIFIQAYVNPEGQYKLLDYDLRTVGDKKECLATLQVGSDKVQVKGQGNGPLEAFVNGMCATLNESFEIHRYDEYALGVGSDVKAISQITICTNERKQKSHGVGISQDVVRASIEAIVAAVNRLWNVA